MAKLTTSILQLTIVQASNYLLPLLTLPFLGRVLSVETFGKLAFAQAIAQYFVMLTEYGFNLTATRRISIARADRSRVSEIFANTMAAKGLLALGGYIAAIALVTLSPKLNGMVPLVTACYVGVIGSFLLPLWLFQGLEEMKALVYATTTARIAAVCAIFLAVRSDSDLIVAALLQNAGSLLAGLFALALIRRYRLVHIQLPSWRGIKEALADGWSMFLANVAISFYTTLNTVLLGLFASASEVAYFAAADKLRFAAQGLFLPIAQAVYPRVSMAFAEGRVRDAQKLMGIGGLMLGGLAVGSGLLFYFGSDYIALHYLGMELLSAATYLQMLAALPLVIAAATVIGQWGLMGAGHARILSRIYLVFGFLHLLYAILLIYMWRGTGLIGSVYLTEILATMAMLWFFLQNQARPTLARLTDERGNTV